jgi:GABA permease
LAVVAVSVIKERVRGGQAVTTAETDTDTDKVSVG